MGILDDWRRSISRRRTLGGLRELRRIREVLEVAVDSYRAANHLPLAFTKPILAEEMPEGVPAGSILRPGDFQMVWFIEELAREYRVPLTAETDLEKLAIDRGWISPEGQLLVVPVTAKGMEWEGQGQRNG